jgi:outer membrane protein assembly factor BamB
MLADIPFTPERSVPTPPRRWLTSTIVLFVLLAGVTPASAEEWSRFRGPNGTGIVPDVGYPIEFGPFRNLKWRSAVRPGKSSPVLSRRHVFLTAYDEGALYTQCFDRETGRLAWERKEAPARREDANGLNEPAASTPVTDGENVYVFFRDFGVVSYDAAGTVRWKKPMGPFANREGAAASPIIAGSSLILVLDQLEGSEIVALSLATGAVHWRVPRHERTEAWSTPAVYAPPGQPAQIVTAGSGLFGGHAADSGARLWTHPGVAPTMVASPVVTGDTVVGFGYGFDSMPPFGEVLTRSDADRDGRVSIAESGTDGWLIGIANFYGNRDGFIVESEWLAATAAVVAPSSLVAVSLVRDGGGGTRARELWRYEKSFFGVVPSPLVLDELVYTIKNGGILTILRADTGEVVKTGRVGAAPASYTASPVATGGRIYLANEDGIVVVLRAGKDAEALAANDLGEPLFATPALSEGRIYVRGQKTLFSFASK